METFVNDFMSKVSTVINYIWSVFNNQTIIYFIQIQSVLKNMNLCKYLKSFSREKIDGELLSKCDEEVLQHDLNVTSAIHRARLMGIITGKVSASNILKGHSP